MKIEQECDSSDSVRGSLAIGYDQQDESRHTLHCLQALSCPVDNDVLMTWQYHQMCRATAEICQTFSNKPTANEILCW